MHVPMLDLLPAHMQPLLLILVALVLLTMTWWQARKGWVCGRNTSRKILRAENPLGFWTVVAAKLLLVTAAISLAMWVT